MLGGSLVGRLHVKLAICATAVVGAVMAAIVLTNLHVQRDNLHTNLKDAALRFSDAALVGFKKPMAQDDRATIDEQLRSYAEGVKGVDVRVFDPGLKVVFATRADEVSRPLTELVESAPLLESVRRSFTVSDGGAQVFDEAGVGRGQRALAVFRPIRNEAACHRCHGAALTTLGGMLVTHSTEGVQRQLADLRLANVAACVAGALVILALLMALLSRVVLGPLGELNRAARAVAEGELAPRAPLAALAAGPAGGGGALGRLRQAWAQDEVQALARGFVSMADSLRSILSAMGQSARKLEEESHAMLETATRQAAMCTQQAAAISEATTTMAEISQTSEQAALHAAQVIEVANHSEQLSREGRAVVGQATASMEEMAGQVQAIASSVADASQRALLIAEIMATVRDIAERSHVLALNAAIESAAAGRAGAGFGVVAVEMRSLAAQSKEATSQVHKILAAIQQGMRAAVGASDQGNVQARAASQMARNAGTSIDGLSDAILQSARAAREIASSTQQQSVGVGQIAQAVHELSAGMTELVDGNQSIEKVAAELSVVSLRLSGLVGRFRT